MVSPVFNEIKKEYVNADTAAFKRHIYFLNEIIFLIVVVKMVCCYMILFTFLSNLALFIFLHL